MACEDNLLAFGELLIDRLTEIIPDCITVPVLDLPEMDEIEIRCPTILVIYSGMNMPQGGGQAIRGALQKIEQRWLTVAAVPLSGLKGSGSIARKRAGDLMAKIADALQGYRFDGYSPLGQITPPGPRFLDNRAMFPLAWQVEFSRNAKKVP